MTWQRLPLFIFLTMMTGCGTTLSVGPMFNTAGEGSGVMVALEQPFWGVGTDDGKLGLVTRASSYGGWSGHQGGYAGGGAGVSYVILFMPAERDLARSPAAAGPLPQGEQPLDVVEVRQEGSFVYMGLSGGYIYSSKLGGELALIAPELGMGFSAGIWRGFVVVPGGKLHCFLSAQTQACGPAFTTTLIPKL